MAIRKNTRRFDPRYFMDEKTETINEAWDSAGKWKSRYSDGRSKSSDVEPETDEERAHRRAKEAREDERRREDGLPPIKSKYFEENVGEEERFTGGSIDIDPLSDEEQDASTDAYYELYDALLNSDLPGNKPSDKLQYALRWIARFEQRGAENRAHQAKLDDAPAMGRFVRGLKEEK